MSVTAATRAAVKTTATGTALLPNIVLSPGRAFLEAVGLMFFAVRAHEVFQVRH
jgi:hypothetical protein